MRIIAAFSVAVLWCTLSGCSTYPTSGFAFRNDSNTLIWVDQVAGFGAGPITCGALAPSDGDPNAVKGIRGVSENNKLPDTATITWWIGSAKPSNPDDIFHADVELPDSLPRHHQILFIYSADGNWSASLDDI
jgi:hypothetical protein